MKTLFQAMLVAAAAVVAPTAMAASTFDLTDRADPGACLQDAANLNTYGNQWTCSQVGGAGDELAVRAYSGAAAANYAAAYATDQNSLGLGITFNGEVVGTPQHSMDNDGKVDTFLLSFDSSIALNTVKLGWSQGDSDISILRWTGAAGAAVSALTSSNIGNLTSSGWSLVGNYNNVGTAAALGFNAGGLTSSYWLVSAYSSTYGGTALDNTLDYVKLLSVGGNCVGGTGLGNCGAVAQAPEPMSLALVGVALLGGAIGSRRRLFAPRA
jgi:hypothetical protein